MSNRSDSLKFKIRHENVMAKIAIVVAILFCMITLIFQSFPLMIAGLVVLALSILWFVFDFIVGATILVNDDTVTIKRLFSIKKIAISDIGALNTDEYDRRRKHRREYRLKMTMYYGSGKRIVLSDNASRINGIVGFVTGERDRRPYVEIPLYQAYMLIKEKKDLLKAK